MENVDVILKETNERLIDMYSNYKGYINTDGAVEYLGIEQAVGELVYSEVESDIGNILLETAKENALIELSLVIDAFPCVVLGVNKEILNIYQRKQSLVMSWVNTDLPEKITIEWDNDWSLRSEFIEDSRVVVDALGMKFYCYSVDDLWETWKLNVGFVNYLDMMSEPLRTKTQYGVRNATTEDEVKSLVAMFKNDLYGLPLMFISEIAPELINNSGLELVSTD